MVTLGKVYGFGVFGFVLRVHGLELGFHIEGSVFGTK